MKKNLLDNYCYTVADNSTDPAKQEKILYECKISDIPYIRLKAMPAYYSGSLSHGMALNWVYRNYIKPKNPRFFGFIDHDIFPIRPHSIIQHLEKSPAYGYLQEKDVGGRKRWYLWPGFVFFDYNFVKNKNLDFSPQRGVDTGGRLWKMLYSNLDKGAVIEPRHGYADFPPGTSTARNFYEYIGDWAHTFDGSNWIKKDRGEFERRQAAVDLLLKKYY